MSICETENSINFVRFFALVAHPLRRLLARLPHIKVLWDFFLLATLYEGGRSVSNEYVNPTGPLCSGHPALGF